MATVLITGIAGFVGSHLVDLLGADNTTRIVGMVHPSHDNRLISEDARLVLRELDILDRESVARFVAEIQPDLVYHLAGFADVHESWKNRQEVLQTNFFGAFALLEACRPLPAFPRVLLVGSAECYGFVNPEQQPITEEHPLAPSSPYAVSKIAQEMLGIQYAQADDLPVFITRSFNHTGPRQKESFVCSAFAHQIAQAEAGLQPPRLTVGNLSSRRDFTDVRDVVRAYRAIVTRGRAGECYNVCSGDARSIQEVLDMLLSLSSTKFEITVDRDKFRPADKPLFLGSYAKLNRDTGWTPSIPLSRTLADLLNYWRRKVASEGT